MHKKIVLLDGGMGQELIKRSKTPPHPLWSTHVLLTEPELVEQVHIDFINSGAQIITLNTYSATPERLDRDGAKGKFDEIQEKAVAVAKKAVEKCKKSNVRIAGCLPPLYGSYKPESAPHFEECVERYMRIANKQAGHVDLFICETMCSIKEGKAAITAAQSHNIETWCSFSIKDDKTSSLRSNESLLDAVSSVEEMKHQANLINCSIPEAISNSLDALKKGSKAYGAYANGFTSIEALEIGGTVDVLEKRKDLNPHIYSSHVLDWVNNGASIVGGCCEISPDHIKYIYKTLLGSGYEIVNSI